MLQLIWNAPVGVSEKALSHGSEEGTGPAAGHIWCVDLEKKPSDPSFAKPF